MKLGEEMDQTVANMAVLLRANIEQGCNAKELGMKIDESLERKKAT